MSSTSESGALPGGAPRGRTTLPWVAGVDGCRAGWVVVLVEQNSKGIQAHQTRLCSRFEEVLILDPKPAAIAIDIPIGLLAESQPGGRECDRQARRLLGRRASSVFTPPTRNLLEATHYEQVRAYGLSIQAFGIVPKIREVDRMITAALQNLVYEAHPELAFRFLVGSPMQHNKKIGKGREERLQALAQAPGDLFRGIRQAFTDDLKTFKRTQVAPDDLLDAYAVAWTALRIANQQAECLPANPLLDRKGLRMEIWY
jgi:predicted RNase H-like nuclease